MKVFQLIYVSRAAQTDKDWVYRTVNSIKQYAVDRNPLRGVSGVLVYGDGRFLQLLEGPEEWVRDTFARISQDRRHHSVQVVCERFFPVRVYPEPSLGVLNVGELGPDDLPERARALLKPAEGESEEQWRRRVNLGIDLLLSSVFQKPTNRAA